MTEPSSAPLFDDPSLSMFLQQINDDSDVNNEQQQQQQQQQQHGDDEPASTLAAQRPRGDEPSAKRRKRRSTPIEPLHDLVNIAPGGGAADDSAAEPKEVFVPTMLPKDRRECDIERNAEQEHALNGDPTCELCRVNQLFSSGNVPTGSAVEESFYIQALNRYNYMYVNGVPDEQNANLVAMFYNTKCWEMDQRRRGVLGLRKWTGVQVLYHFRKHTRNPYYMLQDHIDFLQESLVQLKRNGVWQVNINDLSQTPVLNLKQTVVWTRLAKLQMDMIKQAELIRVGGAAVRSGAGSTGASASSNTAQNSNNSAPANKPAGNRSSVRFSDAAKA